MRIAAASSAVEDNISKALHILRDVGESLTHIPYVKSVAGISIQILEIRDVCFWNICIPMIEDSLANYKQQGHMSLSYQQCSQTFHRAHTVTSASQGE